MCVQFKFAPFKFVARVALFLMGFYSSSTSFASDGFDSVGFDSVRPTVSLGSGILFERGNDNLTQSTRLPLSIGAGARFREWNSRIEYHSFRTSDGNQTLSVVRQSENVTAWGSYDLKQVAVYGWTPYIALGLGAARTSVETRGTLGTDKNEGSWGGVFAGSVGLSGAWSERFAVRPEIRYESAEAFKTKDARWGVFIQIDTIF